MDDKMHITLRALEPSDLDFLYHLENLPEVWRVGWGDAPVSRQQLWEYIQNYRADIYADRQLQLVIDFDGVSVGSVELTDFSPRHARAMVGIALLPQWRHQGIATLALEQLIVMCKDIYGMHQLTALVPKDNTTSLRLFTALHFKTSGCLRSWLRDGSSWTDVVIMQLML